MNLEVDTSNQEAGIMNLEEIITMNKRGYGGYNESRGNGGGNNYYH